MISDWRPVNWGQFVQLGTVCPIRDKSYVPNWENADFWVSGWVRVSLFTALSQKLTLVNVCVCVVHSLIG